MAYEAAWGPDWYWGNVDADNRDLWCRAAEAVKAAVLAPGGPFECLEAEAWGVAAVTPILRAIRHLIKADPKATSIVISREMARDLREHFDQAGTVLGDVPVVAPGGVLYCYGRVMLKVDGTPWKR